MIRYTKYKSFGETLLDTLGVTRQGIYKLKIDNGKLTMNRQDNIANYTIGNCQLSILNFQLAIDPLWEKYYGWTPYQVYKEVNVALFLN
ncbi:MAG: hypothetical protein KIT33_14845 [Candidatus Kapabacteria bacterium]|nr:hypothetical protein [Ignavibacteriota bacterium]MCW5886246.1 hypothetical protein [Candidatus Kapabacteria bacterium]